jgi:uncharacterized membrane protein
LKKPLTNFSINKTKALKLIILFGIISLFGDLIYEGARSVMVGLLYEYSIPILIAIIIVIEIIAIPFFFIMGKNSTKEE